MDLYLLRAFIQLFAGTFFICLFILVMMIMYKSSDELLGKGLPFGILVEFLWYTALHQVHLALPLAVLLAALITFGNMGEKLELLSMKAAGISLFRIFRPVGLFVVFICGVSFYFQNKVSPEATAQFAALKNSLTRTSPELSIPEGQFYQVGNYNFYVEHKDPQTGMLYDVMIYNFKQNMNDGYAANSNELQVTLADSGRLQTTADLKHLRLTLYGGERFQNLESQPMGNGMMKASVPYMRETFLEEVAMLEFDSEMNLDEAEAYKHDPRTKGVIAIGADLDSLMHESDSIGHAFYANFLSNPDYLKRDLPEGIKDSAKIVAEVGKQLPLDTILARLTEQQRREVWTGASTHVQRMKGQSEFNVNFTDDTSKKVFGINDKIRSHRVEWNRKFTVSLACLLFFFIGAPLGAIIRKGGLGLPVFISVLFYIFYTIVDDASRSAKDGVLDVLFGTWLSTMVLAPIGIFLTYKANRDSAVFNMDGYRSFLRRLIGLREKRKLNRKEVVVSDPDYDRLQVRLAAVAEQCSAYSTRQKLWLLPSYIRLFFHYREDRVILQMNEELEDIVKELHNSSDSILVSMLNQLPMLVPDAHTRPFRSKKVNMVVGIILPLGLFFYLRVWRYRIRLHRDLASIRSVAGTLTQRMARYVTVADEVAEAPVQQEEESVEPVLKDEASAEPAGEEPHVPEEFESQNLNDNE